jgi:proteasome beta subunit
MAREFAEIVGFPGPIVTGSPSAEFETHGTTVLAIRFDGGVVVLADRRATAGNLIMFDHAEKIMALDDGTVIAISGAFARSVEVCRFLRHNFNYYRRSVLQELSLEGKLAEISRALAGNAPMAMQGIGVFLPIVAAYDRKANTFGVYFFDGAGARFENGSYACAGSGSERIRGAFELLARRHGPFETRPQEEVLSDGLELLDIASDLDSATGGLRKIPPTVHVLDREGTRPLAPEEVQAQVNRLFGR